MKRKTYLWQLSFSSLVVFLILLCSLDTNYFIEFSVLTILSYLILVFSEQKDKIIILHNALNILILTLLFILNIRGIWITLGFLISIFALILSTLSMELTSEHKIEDYEIKKLESDIKKLESKDKKITQKKTDKEKEKKGNKKYFKEIKENNKNKDKKENRENKKNGKKVRYVAGKFSDQYHVEDCPVAKRLIKKRYYDSKEKAELAGLKPHSCVKD